MCALVACGDDGPPQQPDARAVVDWPAMSVPTSTVPEAGIRRDVFSVPGVTAERNPVTDEGSPGALEATQVLRYRQDVQPPVPAQAVLVAMPGFLGGGNSWDALARNLVRQGAAQGYALEVWAIDRRANLQEDLRGADSAEAASDPEIAQGYYFRDETVGGQAFPGFLRQDDVSYMSEWGLATHVEDLRRVIDTVPAGEQRARVFLLGHSLGASFTEAYAAWRFDDGSRGVEQLAGLVLIDGALGDTPLSEEEYHMGAGAGFTAVPGVDAIRETGPRYFELPLLGVSVLARIEVMGLRVLLDPEGVVEDEGRDDALRLLLQLGADDPPAMTNAAAFGFGLDDGSNGLSFTAVSCGAPAGGAVEEYDNILSGVRLIRPTDLDATYTWDNAGPDTPGEFTPIENLANSMVHGVSNFAEWYFPVRLTLDLSAVAGAAVPDDGYQASEGLRAFDGALIDAPILAISAGLAAPDRYESVRARVAPTVGAGRVNEGADRNQDAGFLIIDAQELTHVDPLSGGYRPDNPVTDAILDFAMANAAPGEVTIPVME